MKILYVLLVFMISCGRQELVFEPEETQQQPNTHSDTLEISIDRNNIDDPAIPYVMEFLGNCERFNIIDLCKKNFAKITSIKMVPKFDQLYVVGLCYISPEGRNIEIIENMIDYDSAMFRALMFHEMAHCLLGNPFPHYEEKDDIMNPGLLTEKTFQSTWPALIKALFARAGGHLNLHLDEQVEVITHKTLISPNGKLSCKEDET